MHAARAELFPFLLDIRGLKSPCTWLLLGYSSRPSHCPFPYKLMCHPHYIICLREAERKETGVESSNRQELIVSTLLSTDHVTNGDCETPKRHQLCAVAKLVGIFKKN
jgi:hypothetical protein